MAYTLTPFPTPVAAASRAFVAMLSGGFYGTFLTGAAVIAIGVGAAIIGPFFGVNDVHNWKDAAIGIGGIFCLGCAIGMFSAAFWLAGAIVLALPGWAILHLLRLRQNWHLMVMTAGLSGLASAYLFDGIKIIPVECALGIALLGGAVGHYAHRVIYGADR